MAQTQAAGLHAREYETIYVLRPDVARRFVVHHRPLGLTHLIATKLDAYNAGNAK